MDWPSAVGFVGIVLAIAVICSGWPRLITINNYYGKEGKK